MVGSTKALRVAVDHKLPFCGSVIDAAASHALEVHAGWALLLQLCEHVGVIVTPVIPANEPVGPSAARAAHQHILEDARVQVDYG